MNNVADVIIHTADVIHVTKECMVHRVQMLHSWWPPVFPVYKWLKNDLIVKCSAPCPSDSIHCTLPHNHWKPHTALYQWSAKVILSVNATQWRLRAYTKCTKEHTSTDGNYQQPFNYLLVMCSDAADSPTYQQWPKNVADLQNWRQDQTSSVQADLRHSRQN